MSNPLVPFLVKYTHDPVLFTQEVLGGTPDPEQIQVMQEVAAGTRRISVRSGHGVGKSTLLAWLTVWFAVTRFPQKTLCTAPTSAQLFDALASETKTWFKRLPAALQELFEIKVDSIVLRAAPTESFISFATSRPETPEALAGKHSANMLLIADEASGIPEAVFEAAMGSLAGEHRQMILTGNPVRSSGLFFETHHRLSDTWKCFHISCVGHSRIPPDFAEHFANLYGEDSNAYRVRVLGEFPKSEDDVVIPHELAYAALLRDVKPLLVRPVWGLDCAYTGADRSALAKRQGNTLMEKVQTWKGLDTMQLAGTIHNEWKDTPASLRPEEILVDAIGYGAGVADRLRELGLPARGINVAELPALKDRYRNLRVELYFLAREWFEKRDCNIHNDELLLRELTSVHVLPPTSGGKVQLEGNDKIRKTLHMSPDLASAFVLTFASQGASALYGSKQSIGWATALKRTIKGIV